MHNGGRRRRFSFESKILRKLRRLIFTTIYSYEYVIFVNLYRRTKKRQTTVSFFGGRSKEQINIFGMSYDLRRNRVFEDKLLSVSSLILDRGPRRKV